MAAVAKPEAEVVQNRQFISTRVNDADTRRMYCVQCV